MGVKGFLRSLLQDRSVVLYFIIIGMLAVTMYYVSVLIENERREEQDEARQATLQRKLVIEQHREQASLLGDLINKQNILGNLSATERGEVVRALQLGIPQLINLTQNMVNATDRMEAAFAFLRDNFGEEYIIDEVRQYNQSNFTVSRIPVIEQKLDRLLNNLSSQTNR